MRLVSSDNLIGFIASTVEALRDEIATMRVEMATKQDLAGLEMVTKQDLARLEGRLDVATSGIRGDIQQVHLRLESIEHGMSSRFEHVEGEISRYAAQYTFSARIARMYCACSVNPALKSIIRSHLILCSAPFSPVLIPRTQVIAFLFAIAAPLSQPLPKVTI